MISDLAEITAVVLNRFEYKKQFFLTWSPNTLLDKSIYVWK